MNFGRAYEGPDLPQTIKTTSTMRSIGKVRTQPPHFQGKPLHPVRLKMNEQHLTVKRMWDQQGGPTCYGLHNQACTSPDFHLQDKAPLLVL